MANRRARDLRQNQTEAEKLLWSRLRNRQVSGEKFKRQVPRGPYFVDFVCLEQKLVVEVDGGQHTVEAQAAADRSRTAFLESEGFRVLRFWNHEVLGNVEGVMAVIASVLEGR